MRVEQVVSWPVLPADEVGAEFAMQQLETRNGYWSIANVHCWIRPNR